MSKSSIYFTSIVLGTAAILVSIGHFIRFGSLKVIQFIIHPAIELINYCQTVFAEILNNPTTTASLIAFMFVSMGSLLVLALITNAIRKYTNLTLLLEPSIYSQKLIQVAQELSITTDVICLPTNSIYSFCAGLIQPKIYVSKGLVDTFSEKELKAVLAHEGYHAKSYDPLKSLIISYIAKTPFVSTLTKRISQRFTLFQELDADAYAIQRSDKTTFLHALTKASYVHEIPVPAFSNAQALRLEHHLSYKSSYKTRGSLLGFATMVTFLVLVNLLVLNLTKETVKDSTVHALSHSEAACQSEVPVSFISNSTLIHS